VCQNSEEELVDLLLGDVKRNVLDNELLFVVGEILEVNLPHFEAVIGGGLQTLLDLLFSSLPSLISLLPVQNVCSCVLFVTGGPI